jgi:bud emergence protein 1
MSRVNPKRDSVASARTIANMKRAMQALRRSIKGDKDKSPQISIAPKSAVAIVPPKKVRSSLGNYRTAKLLNSECTVRMLMLDSF